MTHEEISFQTKKQLAEALKKAMNHKPFSKITVSELVKACNMNRNTFYYHFEDIYDLLRWMFEQETVEVVRQFDVLKDYAQVINYTFDYIEANQYIINSAYDATGKDALRRFFRDEFHGTTLALIERIEERKGKKLDENYREFLCEFLIEGLSGILIAWIKKETKRDRDTASKNLIRVITGCLESAFDETP